MGDVMADIRLLLSTDVLLEETSKKVCNYLLSLFPLWKLLF